MNPYDFVQLTLLANGKSIKGKTKLQKTVYFLGVLTNSLDQLGYRAHYHGPYSSHVAEAVDDLRGLGFVDQSIATVGSVDSSGFEVARHDFSLNDDGKTVAGEKAKKHSKEFRKIADLLKKHRAVFDQHYERLSIAAKTYFLLGEKKGTASLAELPTLAGKFGWSVSRKQIEDAIRKVLVPLGLVKLDE